MPTHTRIVADSTTLCGWLWTALLLFLPLRAAADTPLVGASEAEARVRQFYVEGFPFEAGRNLSPAAVDRLAEMLASDEERTHWSNVVLALGLSESPRAFAPLAAFAARPPRGEATPDAYRAQMALPIALGHLARSRMDAFTLLSRMARETGRDPGWSFQSLGGADLSAALERAAVTGLAVSGRPEAAAILDELAGRPAGPDAEEWERHLDFARALRARIASKGPLAVFGPAQARGWTRR